MAVRRSKLQGGINLHFEPVPLASCLHVRIGATVEKQRDHGVLSVSCRQVEGRVAFRPLVRVQPALREMGDKSGIFAFCGEMQGQCVKIPGFLPSPVRIRKGVRLRNFDFGESPECLPATALQADRMPIQFERYP